MPLHNLLMYVFIKNLGQNAIIFNLPPHLFSLPSSIAGVASGHSSPATRLLPGGRAHAALLRHSGREFFRRQGIAGPHVRGQRHQHHPVAPPPAHREKPDDLEAHTGDPVPGPPARQRAPPGGGGAGTSRAQTTSWWTTARTSTSQGMRRARPLRCGASCS